MDFKNFKIENGVLSGSDQAIDSGDANLGKLFLDTLKSKPDFVGQIDSVTGQETTYGQMADESVRCALWLKKQGISHDDVVYTCNYNQLSSYISLLATYYNSAVHSFGFKGMDIDTARCFLRLMKPKYLFIEEDEVKLYEEVSEKENLNAKIITFTKVPGYFYLNDILKESEEKEVSKFHSLAPLNPNDNCLFALTSGTTNISKLVAHSYKATMDAMLLHINKQQTESVSLTLLPLHWSLSFRVVMVDILNFTKKVVTNELLRDLDTIFQIIEKYKVTKVRFSLVVMYEMYKWKDIEKYDTSSIKTLTFSGVKLQEEMIRFLMNIVKNGHVEQAYGTTEMTIPMSSGRMDEIDINSCGYLFPNMSMKIVDVNTKKIMGPKEKGEICFKSRFQMKGYYEDQKATDQVVDPEGWYHTGDLGYYDTTGLVYVLGRAEHSLILSDGKIVSLWDVDRALLLNSEVGLSFVYADQVSGSVQVFAAVTLLPGSKITEAELTEVVNKYCNIKLPIKVKFIDEIPLTSNGKIRIAELKQKVNDLIKAEEL